jgi:hypothetical protein
LNGCHYRRGEADVVHFERDALFREAGWDTAFFATQLPENVPSEWARYFADELQYGHACSVMQKLGMSGNVVYSFAVRDRFLRLLSKLRPDVARARNLYRHPSTSVLQLLRREGTPWS